MLGLILKDLYTLKKYGKTLLVMMAFFGIMGLAQQNMFFLTGMIPMFCMMTVITTLSYDEYFHWHRLALAMPYSRRDIIGGKYLLVLLLLVMGFGVSAIIGVAASFLVPELLLTELLLTAIGACLAALVLVSVLLPLVFRFGVEKSRIMLFGIAFLPTIALFLLQKFDFAPPSFDFVPPSIDVIKALLIASPVLCIGAFGISYLITCSIFAKKDL